MRRFTVCQETPLSAKLLFLSWSYEVCKSIFTTGLGVRRTDEVEWVSHVMIKIWQRQNLSSSRLAKLLSEHSAASLKSRETIDVTLDAYKNWSTC
jgi:hypothetical protein